MIVSHLRELLLLVIFTRGWAAQSDPSPSQAAQAALESKDYIRAESLYRKVVQQAPTCAECFQNLGIALHSQGKSTEAIQVFQKALQIKELPGSLALLGAEYCRIGQYDRARPILVRAKAYFSDSNVLGTLGPCYLDAGDPIDAITVYRELARRSADPADENAVNLARAYWSASQTYIGRLRKAPGNTHYLAAVAAAEENASPDARGAFSIAFANAPYLRKDMSPGEIARHLHDHPNDPALLYILGVLCGEQAMKTVLFSQEHYPNSFAVVRLRAEMLASQGEEEAALQAYKGLETANPVPSGLYAEIAILYRKRGDWENALEYFNRQRAREPDDEQAMIGVSESLLKLERYDRLKFFLLPIASSEGHPQWALLNLAAAEKLLGRPQAAIRWLERAAQQDPHSATVHYRLGRLYSETNQPGMAEREMKIFQRLKRGANSD